MIQKCNKLVVETNKDMLKETSSLFDHLINHCKRKDVKIFSDDNATKANNVKASDENLLKYQVCNLSYTFDQGLY